MEMFEIFKQFVKPELLILIPVIYLIGMGIKKSEIKDKYIPILLGIIGVILSSMYTLATSDINNLKTTFMVLFVSLTQGILTAGVSVYFNQIYKQIKKEDK